MASSDIEEQRASSDEADDNLMTNTDESEEYSRRGFLETAAATGTAGVAVGLAGCSGNGNGGGTDGGGDGSDGSGGSGDGGDGGDGGGGGGTDPTGTQDFLWWTMEGYVPEITQAIKDAASGFEDIADNPVNVTTEVVVWSDVFQEWEASIEGRSTPNVSQMGNEHSTDFGNRGANRPITEVFEKYDDWYEMMDPWASWDGEKWGVPWYLETRPLYSNMEALEAAGHSSPPETWTEMVQTAIDVSEETDFTGYGDAGARDFVTGQHVFAYTAQSGGTMYDYDEDAGEWRVTVDDPLSLFTHLWYASHGKEWDTAPGGWGSTDSQSLLELYREGRLGMARQTGGLAAQLANEEEDLTENTEVNLVPTGPDGTNWSYYGGGCLSPFTDEVSKHNVNDEMEDAFMDHMIQPDVFETQMLAGAPRMLPTRTAQEEIQPFTDNPTNVPSDWLDAFVEQAATALRTGIHGGGRNAPFLGALEGSTTSYSTAISSIIGADEDPKRALQKMANNMRDTISDQEDYDLPKKGEDELPSLDDIEDAPDEVYNWIDGSGDTPGIWNPYE